MKLQDLKPNPRNPRKISSQKLDMLSAALHEFGDLGGFIYNVRTEQLVGGHQRKKSLPPHSEITIETRYSPPTRTGTVAEGYLEIEGERFRYRAVDWDRHREMAANIAANKGAGMWDLPELSDWLVELDGVNFNLDLTMFDADERADIVAPIHHLECDEDDVPEVPSEVTTRLGDIYKLGAHRLMCGDSTAITDVDNLIAGEKPDMVFTDPPYGIDIVKNSKSNKGVMAAPGIYRDIMGDDSTTVALDVVRLCIGLQIKTMLFWGANYFSSALPDSQKWIVWDKKRPEGTTFSDCELAWTNLPGNIKKYEFFWHGMMQEGERETRVHPTQKPVGLIMKTFSDLDVSDTASVLDLFGGSGSTMIACEKTNRQCFMMELDPKYCDVIIARWEKYTGQQAELINKETPKNGEPKR